MLPRRAILFSLLMVASWAAMAGHHALAASAPAAATPSQVVRYDLDLRDPASQYVSVRMCLDQASQDHTVLAMPAYAPGSYRIRDFGRHVFDMRAIAQDRARLEIDKTDKQTWVIRNQGRPFCVHYRVFADEASVRTSHLDSRYALLNGTSVFLYVHEQTNRPAHLTIAVPPRWQAHVALPSKGSYHLAANYDELADSPILAGLTQTRHFRVGNREFNYVVVAPAGTNADLDRLARDAKAVSEFVLATMGELDLKHYSFLNVLDVRGGGLEHRASTAMMVDAWAFATPKGYRNAAALAAHEFFHAWNVKRLHAPGLGPFDYRREVYTDLLWFHEGFTDTIEGRALLQSGIISQDAYLRDLEALWNRYLERPGRNYEAIDQLSRDAWVKEYQTAANQPNTMVSYYTKGEVLGVALDLELRLRSAKHQRQGSLAGLFRQLWQERQPTSDSREITWREIVAAATNQAGEDMQPFFDRYVRGREEIPLPSLLQQIGIEVKQHPVWLDADGKVVDDKANLRPYTGAVLTAGQTKVSNIEPQSPAARAGLMIDDEIIAVAGARVRTDTEFRDHLANRRSGERVDIAFFRQQNLEHREVTLIDNPSRVFVFRKATLSDADANMQAVRALWLNEKP